VVRTRLTKSDAFWLVALSAYAFAWWWPTRALPYHWDAATFVIRAARDLSATHFRPFVAGHSDFAHPPLFMAALAITWRVFDESLLTSHAFVLPAMPLALMGTYALGSCVRDRTVGVVSAVLLGGVAVVLEEYGQIYMDLPVAAVVAWGLWAWFDRRSWLAALLFTVAAMLKLPTLVVPATLMVCGGRRRSVLVVPFVAAVLWLAYHHGVTGFWLTRPGRRTSFAVNGVQIAGNVVTVARRVLLEQWRFLLLIAAVAGVLARRRRSRRMRLWPLFAVVAISCVFFGVFGEFGLRYGIFVMPPYFVACVALARDGSRRKLVMLGGLVVTFAAFQTTWHPHRELTSTLTVAPDQDLGYLDMIHVGLDEAKHLQERYPSAEVYGTMPESYELTEPFQGYVERPLAFAPCNHFVPKPTAKQIIVRHDYDAAQVDCARVIETSGARFHKRFTSNDKWLELYIVPKPKP
jgi:hypothetical protein